MLQYWEQSTNRVRFKPKITMLNWWQRYFPLLIAPKCHCTTKITTVYWLHKWIKGTKEFSYFLGLTVILLILALFWAMSGWLSMHTDIIYKISHKHIFVNKNFQQRQMHLNLINFFSFFSFLFFIYFLKTTVHSFHTLVPRKVYDLFRNTGM